MRLGVLVIVLLIVGCGERANVNYLQDNQISLVSPMVTVSNIIIDSTVTISVRPSEKGASIRYTSDGSKPTIESALYSNPIQADSQAVYQFKAFHSSWKPSEVTSVKLYKKGIAPNHMVWHTSAHKTYPGKGALPVINEKKAVLDFKDEQWIGFDTIASATVYFEEKTYLKTMTLGYLVDTKSWIFPPTEVLVAMNNEKVEKLSMDWTFHTEIKKMDDVIVPIERAVDSITISVKNLKNLPSWHPGSGQKAWLFMDEWIFN